MFRITRYVYDPRACTHNPLSSRPSSPEKRNSESPGGPRNHSLSIEAVRGLFRAYPVAGSEKMKMHARGLESGETRRHMND